MILFWVASLCKLVIAKEKLDFATILDTVYKNQIDQISYETLTENLWDSYQHPIDLNSTSREEIKRLHILSEEQLENFFAHLYKNGVLVSIYELQAIPGLDLATIERLLPFVKVEETYPQQTQGLQALFGERPTTYGYWLSRYERILESQKGYQFNKKSGKIPYQGSPHKIVTRLKWKHPNGWGFGIAARKYPGEEFTWDHAKERYGFDSWSSYLSVENKKWLKKLVIANYQVGYGQGLVINAGFNMDKSGETIPIIRVSNAGIKPHSSFNNQGFRGIAATFNWGPMEQSLYYAYNSLDSKVLQDTSTGKYYTEGIQRSGLHRTEQEISKKAQIYEQVMGSTLVYKFNREQAELGLNAVYSHYEIPIQINPKKPSYYFSGKYNFNVGFFYRYLWRSLHFFGENAFSKSGGSASILGVIASLSSNLDISLLLRHYKPDFHSFYGDAFRENSSGNCNEQGIYIGVGIQPIKKIRINAYYDYFNFPQPTTRIAKPSSGYSWLTKATYQVNRTNLVIFQYREVRKDKNVPKDKLLYQKDAENKVATYNNRKYKTQFKQQLNKFIDLHSEIQASTYNFLKELTWGYGIAQSITYKLKRASFTGQIAWFDTDSDNRLYLHEKSSLHSKAIPSVNKKGIKYYMLVTYKPTPNWRIEAKYSITWHLEETSIGSGQEEIDGNTKNTVSLQLIYRF
ncbi:hypothetical protein Aasi_1497 [Candidatus Amoebophilus asiaticus 5a2]|uniref:Uncharacterized protein n=1 Tax=Amoebophilus asiaticus (strain 5a2) TaxID=452471 RepID=C3L4E5_AMOA5|nr:helix-hairpin-helix domain-containing protein [Candidatus Amoebophilus asiaticus]ACP20862.1 hypothetical protein Aasi_1497 [Candidatus Amoebophilus asiaticus 5a2]